MAITKEFVENVRGRLTASPGIATSLLAEELGAPETQVITALPVKMRQKARPEDFADIWAGLARLSNLPENGVAAEELGAIWFINRPDAAVESHSVQFFNKQGGHLFSVYLNGTDGREAYASLRERFGVVPVPKMHCRGCGNCTCGSKHKKHGHEHAHHAHSH